MCRHHHHSQGGHRHQAGRRGPHRGIQAGPGLQPVGTRRQENLPDVGDRGRSVRGGGGRGGGGGGPRPPHHPIVAGQTVLHLLWWRLPAQSARGGGGEAGGAAGRGGAEGGATQHCTPPPADRHPPTPPRLQSRSPGLSRFQHDRHRHRPGGRPRMQERAAHL